MEKGYIIENYNITDKEAYIPPVKNINKILEDHKGKFLVATPFSETLNGSPKEVIIVMEFDSEQSAKSFYNSESYKEYKNLYNRTTIGWISFAPAYVMKQ